MFTRSKASMRTLSGIAFGVLVGLLAAGLILLVDRQPQGEPIALHPPPTPLPVTVHVTGAVAVPGIYALPPGCRVQQAVDAAGGIREDADLQAVNLALPLEDGDRVEIPVIQPTSLPLPTFESRITVPTLEALPFPSPENPININHGTQAELESLPGIGPVLAAQIIAYRQANGPFKRIEDIMDVPGIGIKTFEKIELLIEI